MIVTETNIYAEEVFLESSFDKSRISRWKPVTHDEILRFIGLVMHTGTIKLNRIQDYWKHHPLFNLKCFSQHMSRNNEMSAFYKKSFRQQETSKSLTQN
jgi:hypothetical protein